MYKFDSNNGFASCSRNMGLEISNCKFTCFLDADDIFFEEQM